MIFFRAVFPFWTSLKVSENQGFFDVFLRCRVGSLVSNGLTELALTGESQNRCFKKTKRAKFSEKWAFLTHWYEHLCVRIRGGGEKCLFFREFGILCFLETPVLRFALLPYYRDLPKKFHSNLQTNVFN